MNFTELKLPELTVNKKQLFSSNKQNNPKLIYLLINEFNSSNDEPFFTGLSEPKIDKSDKDDFADTLKKIGQYLIKEYEQYGRNDWKHDEQRKVLEKAVRLFDKVNGIKSKENKIDVSVDMARAYLYRSRIIRPKGFTPPAKKIEALKKALELCKKSRNPEAKHIAGLAALELNRCELPVEKLEECGLANDEIKKMLKNATKGVSIQDFSIDKIIEFYQIRLLLEYKENGDYQDEIIKNVLFSFTGKDGSKLEDGLELEQYKVAVINNMDQRETFFIKLYNRLRHNSTPFFHPLWSDTVKFIRYLYKSKKPAWKRAATLLWDLAEEKSLKISSLHIRWYWSKQRDLYDLAFLAAIEDNDLKLANDIADSIKSRPALTWQVIEQVNNEKLNKVLEQYAKALGSHYIKGLSKTKPEIPKKNHFKSEVTKTNSIIVQFYLVQLEEFEDDRKGFALIYNNGWNYDDKYRFNYNLIWNKYQEWQSLYFSFEYNCRDGSSKSLKELCKISGEELNFLFKITEEKRNMVLIPHDFLHRIPIHSSIHNRSILCAEYNCTYWPTLSMKPVENMEDNKKTQILQYFSEKEERILEGLKSLHEKFDIKKIDASLEDLTNLKNDSPGLLTILCHGQADTVNPFFSKLLLKDHLSLLSLASQESFLSGNRVYLGACETDLMTPLNNPIDEHISAASILLLKGASEVLATMWEVQSDFNNEFIEKILKKLKDEAMFDPINTILEGFKEIKYLIKDDINIYTNMCFKLYKCAI